MKHTRKLRKAAITKADRERVEFLWEHLRLNPAYLSLVERNTPLPSRDPEPHKLPSPDWDANRVITSALKLDPDFFQRRAWKQSKLGSPLDPVRWNTHGREGCAWNQGAVKQFNQLNHPLIDPISKEHMRRFLNANVRMDFVLDTAQSWTLVQKQLKPVWNQIYDLRKQCNAASHRKPQKSESWRLQLEVYKQLSGKEMSNGKPALSEDTLVALLRTIPFTKQLSRTANPGRHKREVDLLRITVRHAFAQSKQRVESSLYCSLSGELHGHASALLAPFLSQGNLPLVPPATSEFDAALPKQTIGWFPRLLKAENATPAHGTPRKPTENDLKTFKFLWEHLRRNNRYRQEWTQWWGRLLYELEMHESKQTTDCLWKCVMQYPRYQQAWEKQQAKTPPQWRMLAYEQARLSFLMEHPPQNQLDLKRWNKWRDRVRCLRELARSGNPTRNARARDGMNEATWQRVSALVSKDHYYWRMVLPNPAWETEEVLQYVNTYDPYYFSRPEWIEVMQKGLLTAVRWNQRGGEETGWGDEWEHFQKLQDALAITEKHAATAAQLCSSREDTDRVREEVLGEDWDLISFEGTVKEYDVECGRQLALIKEYMRVFLTEHSRMDFVIDSALPWKRATTLLKRSWDEIQGLRHRYLLPSQRKAESVPWDEQLKAYDKVLNPRKRLDGWVQVKRALLERMFPAQYCKLTERIGNANRPTLVLKLDLAEARRQIAKAKESGLPMTEYAHWIAVEKNLQRKITAWNEALKRFKQGTGRLRSKVRYSYEASSERIQKVFKVIHTPSQGYFSGDARVLLVPVLYYPEWTQEGLKL